MANGSASARASASARLDTGPVWPGSAWSGFGAEGATGEEGLGMVRLGPVASFASKQVLRFASPFASSFASWFASVLLRGLLEALASFCFEAFASRLLRRDSPEATPPACPALALFSLSSLPEVPPNFIRVSASTTIHRPAASAGSSIPAASSSATCRALPFSERTTVRSNAPSNAGNRSWYAVCTQSLTHRPNAALDTVPGMVCGLKFNPSSIWVHVMVHSASSSSTGRYSPLSALFSSSLVGYPRSESVW